MREFMGRVSEAGEDKRSNSQKIAELLAKQRAEEKATEQAKQQAAARTTRDFREYHTAWQDYYKKYYENIYGKQTAAQKTTTVEQQKKDEDPLDKRSREMGELRSKIRNATRESARRARRSKHFIPLLAGGLIVLVLLFVQFNTMLLGWVRAYVVPAKPAPGITELDPTLVGAIGPETKLIIPKINIDVPINLDVDASSIEAQMKAMENGIMHFAIAGANALPGQFGNFVVSGHSSNDAFTRGEYKFIFAKLDQAKEGDMIYVNYGGVRYTYAVRSTKVVNPEDTASLMLGTSRKMLTIVTCTPLGTAKYRLLVFAEQVAPTDSTETPPPETTPPGETPAGEVEPAMPGNSPTLFERFWNWLFGRD